VIGLSVLLLELLREPSVLAHLMIFFSWNDDYAVNCPHLFSSF
jgi:hypothetical protein